MEENQTRKDQQSKTPIDFGAIWTAILKYKKLYYKTLGIAFVLALVIGFSLPKSIPVRFFLRLKLVAEAVV